VSSKDAQRFVENTAIQLDNAQYAFQAIHTDNEGSDFFSAEASEVAYVGTEMFHSFETTQEPDGTYSVGVKQGMNLLSLEAWQTAIDNIPNYVFIKNPRQQKQALKSKFSAVFNTIGENNYAEAIDKLNNDILKKLDADGRADWVREPALVDEITAFVVTLKSRGFR